MTKKSIASEIVPITIPTLPATEVVRTGGGVPYLIFTSAKAKKWPTLSSQLPGLREDEPVLVMPEPKMPLRLAPLRFFFLTGRQFWVEISETGDTLQVSKAPVDGDSTLKNTIESVVIVLHAGKAYPARATFKGVKAGAAEVAAAALDEATTPAWLERSPEFAATGSLKQPWQRFTVTVSLEPRTARSTGRRYVLAKGTILPTGVADVKALDDAQKDPTFQASLLAALESLKTRVAELEGVANG